MFFAVMVTRKVWSLYFKGDIWMSCSDFLLSNATSLTLLITVAGCLCGVYRHDCAVLAELSVIESQSSWDKWPSDSHYAISFNLPAPKQTDRRANTARIIPTPPGRTAALALSTHPQKEPASLLQLGLMRKPLSFSFIYTFLSLLLSFLCLLNPNPAGSLRRGKRKTVSTAIWSGHP